MLPRAAVRHQGLACDSDGRRSGGASGYARGVDEADARRLLGVGPGADRRQVEAAFRARVRIVHPDRGGDPEQFRRVVAARTELTAPGRRPSPRTGAVIFVSTTPLALQLATLVYRRVMARHRPRRVA